MHELDDIALLREFAERGSEPAFAELVTRHVNKVYSVALRHTRNPHQAEAITQDVFVILARKAAQLGKNVILSGWLYQTARLTAVTLIRSEIRRARREQKVLMQTNETEADPWPHIAPLLDDAMAGLSETDRHAVVLRYFDGKSMKEVGAALGGSEDAAKMRVNRAVEKLRTFFAKRGVALPAAALTTAIAAHSVQAAPAGLAAAVTTAALSGTAITTSAIIAATKTIAMTTLQKTLVTVTVAALAGTGIYEARQAAQLRDQNQTLQQQQAPLAEQNQQLQRERDDATNRLAGLADELAKANNKNLELLKLRGELGVLRQQTNELGRLRQENKKLLAQSAAQSDSTNLLSVEDQFTLRQTHVVDAMTTLLNAMKNYAAKHNGQYPGSFDQLIASGDLETSNLAGNLGLDDFELMMDGAVDPLGKKVMLSLRVPIQRTGKQSVIVFGGISDDGVTHTETMNVSSE